jgi:hypothetical protein
MSIKNNNLYSTSDLSLATTLSLFYKIHSLDCSDHKRIKFIFMRDKNFDLYLERYWRGELKVDPQRYFQHLKILKNRIYNI